MLFFFFWLQGLCVFVWTAGKRSSDYFVWDLNPDVLVSSEVEWRSGYPLSIVMAPDSVIVLYKMALEFQMMDSLLSDVGSPVCTVCECTLE